MNALRFKKYKKFTETVSPPRVGKSYQANIPEYLGPFEPVIEQKCQKELKDHKDNDKTIPPKCTMEDRVHLIEWNKESTQQFNSDLTFCLLKHNNYDFVRARDKNKNNIKVPTLTLIPNMRWTKKKKKMFEDAVIKYRADLMKINKKVFPTESLSSLVRYYHRWVNNKLKKKNDDILDIKMPSLRSGMRTNLKNVFYGPKAKRNDETMNLKPVDDSPMTKRLEGRNTVFTHIVHIGEHMCQMVE